MSHLMLLPQKVHFIRDVHLDFLFSRQARLLSPATIEFYEFTSGKFVEWLISMSITEPEQIKATHIRKYLSTQKDKGLADSSIHGRAHCFDESASFPTAPRLICVDIDYINQEVYSIIPPPI